MKDTYVNSCGEVIGTVEVVNDTRVSDEVRFFVEQHT